MNSPHLTSPTGITELRALALQWVSETDPSRKAQGTIAMATSWQAGELSLDTAQPLVAQQSIPGRPSKPELISPKFVKHRSMLTVEGRAAMIHALTHIEFNAINLALDAIWRFADMPRAYYADWLKVAGEEALHFSLLAAHLQTLGFQYGDFPAHDSMWEMADKTSGDILARMALVPRTLEARGLDATPRTRAKLAQAGDHPAAAILDIILRDEIGHVAIGNHWYKVLCDERNLDPVATYATLTVQYKAPVLKGPFNLPARRAAGFSEIELTALTDGVPSASEPK
ncbi:MAG: ferritin-like domain-containing protein [Herminiimonas sp.]|uniref:ferritin-like domain-containing protein n=1 Tax=Herminiimonas sp. TaxID=1926289 RepID=UPI002716DA33|nr:ferritin-like domain-containing protein [Herminiimonas sp.]MDO9421484.1 ferritin-like domain-containing protein [Herminiimonas sp.]